jgi:hypothetical protein
MSNPFYQGHAKAALKDAGPASEPFVVDAMKQANDINVCRMYVQTLGEMGTKQSIPQIQAVPARFLPNQQNLIRFDCERAVLAIQARGK